MMTRKEPYFSPYEIAVLSLCGALIFVSKVLIKVPLHSPGHSSLFVVIPFLVGCGVVRKPGAATYIGLITGLLASFFGLEALHLFDVFKYLAMGLVIDATALVFNFRMDNPAVGFIAGAAGSIAKMAVNYSVHLLLGVPATFIVLGVGVASVTHLVFGGIGGVIGALVIARLIRAGVIAGAPSSS
ncbi:cobalt ABC transporter permease [Methanofollis formosanus]|uniref:Cobalt ABC transporter permease n=1 Tax=Methanofollis formosanus TaxID=299308 RepID=A0A8G1A0W5_9EURY|nr:ECF transporter S component [Methanofollis formosanus]QYZ78505.1 cobalt ABC transporter permease [Methanofollis formosanus]